MVTFATDSITTKKALPSVLTNHLGGLELADLLQTCIAFKMAFGEAMATGSSEDLALTRKRKWRLSIKTRLKTLTEESY